MREVIKSGMIKNFDYILYSSNKRWIEGEHGAEILESIIDNKFDLDGVIGSLATEYWANHEKCPYLLEKLLRQGINKGDSEFYIFSKSYWQMHPALLELCSPVTHDCLVQAFLSGKSVSTKPAIRSSLAKEFLSLETDPEYDEKIIREMIKKGEYSHEDIKEIQNIAGRAIDSITSDGGTGLNWVLLRECAPIGCVSKDDIYKMLYNPNVNKADILKYLLSQEYFAQSDWGAVALRFVMGRDVDFNEASLVLTHIFQKPHWSAHEKAPEFYEKIFSNLDGAEISFLLEDLMKKNQTPGNYMSIAKTVLAQDKYAKIPMASYFCWNYNEKIARR